MTKLTKQQIAVQLNEQLPYFTGSESFTQHIGGFIYTEGVKFVAETAGGYWLLDLIASYQTYPHIRDLDYQFWKLTVDLENESAVIVCVEDTGMPEIVRQEIEYTDFPLPEFELWLSGNVLYLPSEH